MCPTAHYAPDFVLSLHLYQCLSSASSPAKAKVVQLKATGTPASNADKIYVMRRDSVQFRNSTPHRDPVKPEMPIPQRPYFTWHLAVLTYLVFAVPLHSRTPPVLPAQAAGGQGRAGEMLPSPAGQPRLRGTNSPLFTTKRKEKEKKALTSHGQDELWLAWKCCVRQP